LLLLQGALCPLCLGQDPVELLPASDHQLLSGCAFGLVPQGELLPEFRHLLALGVAELRSRGPPLARLGGCVVLGNQGGGGHGGQHQQGGCRLHC
jgi:hypothetical protein